MMHKTMLNIFQSFGNERYYWIDRPEELAACLKGLCLMKLMVCLCSLCLHYMLSIELGYAPCYSEATPMMHKTMLNIFQSFGNERYYWIEIGRAHV